MDAAYSMLQEAQGPECQLHTPGTSGRKRPADHVRDAFLPVDRQGLGRSVRVKRSLGKDKEGIP